MAINVLLVDDSPILRAVIRKTLHLAELPLGEVLEADDGRQALSILASHWVDIVFADVHMPVMNGIELIEEMRGDDLLRSVPVVIVSTEGSATRIEQLMRAGVKAFLRKPVTPEQIKQVLRDVIGFKIRRPRVETLAEVFRDVVERMAFAFPNQVEDPGDLDAVVEGRMAEMSFDGPLRGRLQAAATPASEAEAGSPLPTTRSASSIASTLRSSTASGTRVASWFAFSIAASRTFFS